MKPLGLSWFYVMSTEDIAIKAGWPYRAVRGENLLAGHYHVCVNCHVS